MKRNTNFAAAVMCLFAVSWGFAVDDTAKLIETLREHVSPLEEKSDLDPLLQRVGDARYVLLGESTHGTSEYYTWRAAISQRLIEEKEFSFIAVEGDWGACARVDRYVRWMDGAGESAKEILKTFDRWPRWMWANEEIVELVEWLREFNEDRPPQERVGFHGIDVYGMRESLEATVELLQTLDLDLARKVQRAYACMKPYAENPRGYVESVARQQVNCEQALGEVVQLLRQHRDRLKEADRDAYFAIKQNALAVQYAERHYRDMLIEGPRSWNHRASHFHQTVERLMAHYGEDARAIVWAHNTHVGDARATSMRDFGMNNIGQLKREKHGNEHVVIVGFSCHRGRVLAGRAWEAPQQRMTMPPAMDGSLDALFKQLDVEAFVLVLKDVADVAALAEPRGHRAIGVTYNPMMDRQSNYVATNPISRYDVLIFIEQTTPLRPLHD